jgi:hypothetical protein
MVHLSRHRRQLESPPEGGKRNQLYRMAAPPTGPQETRCMPLGRLHASPPSRHSRRDVLRQNCAFYPLTQPDTCCVHPGPMTSQYGSGCHGGPCSSTNIHLAQPDSAWAHWRQKNCCSLSDMSLFPLAQAHLQSGRLGQRSDDRLCPTYRDRSPSLSFMLYRLGSRAPTSSPAEHHPVSGSILSPVCTPGRKRHLAGLYSASGYSSLTYPGRAKPRHLLVRGHLRDLCYHFLHHLSASAAGPRTPLALAKWHAFCNESFAIYTSTSRVPGRALDRKYLLGIRVPARTYYSVPV